VKVVKEHIRSGDFNKVVLARDLVRSIPPDFSIEATVKKLSDAYPDTFVFSVDGLVGASPETLACVRGKDVSLRVLAGSAPRGVDERDDREKARLLATSTKDLDEHRFAVQNVLHTLERQDITAAADDVPFQLKLPNLWHLATDIRAVLPHAANSIQVIGALHPTAAVAGSPTDAALDFIATHEGLDRGRYCGPVGWVDCRGDGDWAIALRCGQIDTTANTITAYAGAGIVAGSDASKELLETELKFRPIIDTINEQRL
jgi:menaquinone-specific isochorismate synthase